MRNSNNQRRVMDLPPPPPLLRRHHHHLRYGNVLYPPDFIHPTLPSHAGQSLILLQPPASRSSHIAHPPLPPRFNCAPLHHPPLDRSHLYELGLPPKPYLHRKICPPPPLPASTRENIHWRPSHWSGELYNKRDGVKRCGNGMNDDRDYVEKRWDNEKMDYDEMRQDSINGWIHGLYKNRDDDERRRGSGISDHGCKLYCEGGNDERRLNHGTNGADLLGLGSRRPEHMENASSLSRCSGRLRSGVSEGKPVRSKKKRRLQKKNAIYRIESGKDCSKNKGGHNCQKELSGCSLKGKENEGFECLQTRMGSKREKEKSQEHAIPFKRSNALVAKGLLAPLCPDIKTDVDKRIVKTGTRFSIPGLPMARSSEDVVKTDLLVCGLDPRYDSLGTSKELLDKAVVSKSESVADDANDLGEIAVKNQLQKDMNLEGSTFESGSTRRNRLKRKRKAEKMRLHKISVQMREDIGDITNASDCITTSASPWPRSDANDFGEIAVKNQPQKDMDSQGLTVGSGSTRRKNRKARKKLLHETSMEIRKDTGHIINANDYVFPLASPQPCSNANNLREIDINNLQKDMSLEGPTAVGSVSTRRKKRKGRKKPLRETSMQRRENSGCIINASDCIIPSASLQPCSDTALPKRNLSDAFTRLVPESVLLPAFGGIVTKEAYSNGDSCNSFVPYLKRKRSSLMTLSASHYVSASVILESSGHAEKLVTSNEDAEIEHDMRERLLANESTGHGDSLGFNQHDINADKVVLNEVSVSDIEKSKIEPVDQYAKLGTDRVDNISEHPFHGVSPLLENSCVNGASKVMASLEDNDIAGSLQVDRCTSEVHASNTSSKSVNALPLKPENALISEADENPEDVFLNKLNATLVVVDSEEFRSLEGVAISNDSTVISTSIDFLEADQKGIIFDSLSPNSLSKKPFIDDVGSVEGPLEAISNTKTCLSVDCLSNITRKRKDRGAQADLFGTNAALGTSISGEVGRLLAKDLFPAMEIDFPGEEGSSKEVDKSNEGPYRVEYPTKELDFDANHPFPSFSKKRKVASPRSNLSSYLEDEVVADGLNSDCSRLYQGSIGLTELESGKRDDIIFARNTEPSVCQPENEIIFGGENISNKKPVSLSPDLNLFPSVKSLEKAVSVNSQINAELSRSLPEAKSVVVKKWNPVHGNQTLRKNQWTSASPKVFPGRHPLYISNSRNLQSTHVAKSRTWHRNGSSSVAAPEIKLQPSPRVQCHETKIVRTVQSSYTRKGNSLVRNPSPSGSTIGFQNSSCSFLRLAPLTDNLKNKQESDSETGDTDAQSIMRTEQIEVSEMPCKTIDAWEERIKSPGVPECQADSSNSSNHQCTLEEGNPEKKIMYVKRRSNQLMIAASNSDDMSKLGRDKIQASSSDGYYKRKKNQLVRGPSENHVEERNANGNSRRLVSRTSLPRTYARRPYGIAKHSRFSFVWKLHEIHSSEKDKTAMGPQKVLPHLYSWKRSTNWRTFMHALSAKPKKSSFASQTLMLSKKRGAVYTRSTHGYSLRMSKVLSVGGSSLKWSKSIERNSKKANEEVTRAVAAAEKRKKENGALPIALKSRNNVSRKLVISVQLRPGERIFRIGSERYKMDPTRRTLHRIIAEKETSSSVVLQTERNVKRSYVPRRLLIGNEEYVRIGNGNQLVRDPKKRTRVLANEKVRWSLRTARLRLARKRKYCQFFTRFGKCNKDDGKCPYIHDPSKIAVCTKFLNGLCTNVDCKLTHKVVPERMEDCSYFLKGSCSKESCPYRHVIVKPVSAVCKNFLRGYCADGNECPKKHTYACPAFEATGLCPKASTCKLHHPKKKTEKKQPTNEPKMVRGRYFDGGLVGDADVSDAAAEAVSTKGKDDLVFDEGNFPEYISLGVDDDEMDQTLASKDEVCDYDSLGEETDDFDDFDVLV